MKRNHIVARQTSERSRSALKPRVERLEVRRLRFEAEESLMDTGSDFDLVSSF